MKIPITIITGPTCCGKTSTAIELAEKIDGEIISCDSVLVYKGMDIGSAKPTKYEQERVKHHLIDVSDVSQKFDVSKYIEHAKKALADILQRGKQPIIAGGSGFYLKAWFSAVTDNLEIPDEVLRKADEIELQSGDEGLKQALLELDPNAPQ
ncbi:MAG: tRNA (adenosine(37)-N6)-dimethylallyltransferase MiaA, partial [Opitutales bacterium]|nr:tRNA (adenosine(37)-N6)-dimethylallyltransferase MiaA [Opitutales bacterium]